MATRFAIVAIAATLAAATMTARAAGMPDSGTKNFVPGGDAPAYLTNENLAVAPGSPGQSPLGTAFNQAAGPEPAAAAPHIAETRTPRHGGLLATRRSAHRAAANANFKTRSRRLARSSTVQHGRAAAFGQNTRALRTGSRSVAASRAGIAKHGKANARHAAAKSTAHRG